MAKKPYPVCEWQRTIGDATLIVRAKSADELFCMLDYIREYSSGLIPEIWHLKNVEEDKEEEEGAPESLDDL